MQWDEAQPGFNSNFSASKPMSFHFTWPLSRCSWVERRAEDQDPLSPWTQEHQESLSLSYCQWALRNTREWGILEYWKGIVFYITIFKRVHSLKCKKSPGKLLEWHRKGDGFGELRRGTGDQWEWMVLLETCHSTLSPLPSSRYPG